MKLSGETRIAAPRAAVWAALMDPDVLARSIDGVERLERLDGDRFAGTMNAKVGPVRAKFSGEVEITEPRPPEHYVLVGEGKGGVAGFAKGRAAVDLAEIDGGDTLLSYQVDSQVGGKLAQLGARLIEGAAKGYAERFFATFKDIVEGGAGPGPAAATPAAVADPASDAASHPATRPAGEPVLDPLTNPASPAAATPVEPAPSSESTVGSVDAAEPFRAPGSGLGPKGWAFIVIAVAAGIVASQFV